MFKMNTGRFGGGCWHQPWKAQAVMNQCLKLGSVEGRADGRLWVERDLST